MQRWHVAAGALSWQHSIATSGPQFSTRQSEPSKRNPIEAKPNSNHFRFTTAPIMVQAIFSCYLLEASVQRSAQRDRLATSDTHGMHITNIRNQSGEVIPTTNPPSRIKGCGGQTASTSPTVPTDITSSGGTGAEAKPLQDTREQRTMEDEASLTRKMQFHRQHRSGKDENDWYPNESQPILNIVPAGFQCGNLSLSPKTAGRRNGGTNQIDSESIREIEGTHDMQHRIDFWSRSHRSNG